MGHHGDSSTERNSERVERGAHGIGELAEPAEGQVGHRGRRLIGLVDRGHAIGVDREGPIEMITDRQRNLHLPTLA